MIYIIYGDEAFKVNQKINELSREKEQVEFDILKEQVADIHKEIATIDLLSEDKVYVISNLDLFELKKSKLNKAELSLFEKIFDLELEIIIIANKKLNEKTKFYENYFSQIKYFEYLKANINLKAELTQYLLENKIEIIEDAKRHLLSFHEELYALINDVDKMWQYSDMQVIDLQVVEAVGINYITYKVFALYEYMIKSNTQKAKQYYQALLNQSIDDTQIFLIYLTQLNKYYQVKLAQNIYGNNNVIIAKNLKMNPYQVQMMFRHLDYVSIGALKQMVKCASEMDYMYKSGSIAIKDAMQIILNQEVI